MVNQQVFSGVLTPELADRMLCECALYVVIAGDDILDAFGDQLTYTENVTDHWENHVSAIVV